MDGLTSKTPAEIDTALAAIDRRLFVALQTAQNAADVARMYREQHAAGSHYVSAANVAEAKARADAAHAAVDELRAEAAPLHAEFTRRGGWSRAWMVLNTGGHAHRSRQCSTCRPTTVYGWLPQVASMDEDQIVAALGSDACTVCYPTAPVEVLARPRSVFTAEEAEARAAADAKAAEKAAKAAVKAAKAITNPDGTPLRLKGYGEVKTVRTAEIEYVDDAAYLLAVHRDGYPAGREATAAADTAAVLEALAAKNGTDVATERARLDAKVKARYRRDYTG